MSIDPHFDSDMKFKLIELDPVTGNTTLISISYSNLFIFFIQLKRKTYFEIN